MTASVVWFVTAVIQCELELLMLRRSSQQLCPENVTSPQSSVRILCMVSLLSIDSRHNRMFCNDFSLPSDYNIPWFSPHCSHKSNSKDVLVLMSLKLNSRLPKELFKWDKLIFLKLVITLSIWRDKGIFPINILTR